MAKKKGTRKAAPRGTRKASTSRRRVRKAASRPRAETPRRVNLKPLQRILTTEIKRLERYEPSPKVEETLKLLGETKAMLTNACATAPIPMVIDI